MVNSIDNWPVAECELLKKRYNQALPANVYFWRDRAGNEVDVLCEDGDRVSSIEIKSGQTITEDHLAGLRRWIELAGRIAADPRLVYAGNSRYVRSGVQGFTLDEFFMKPRRQYRVAVTFIGGDFLRYPRRRLAGAALRPYSRPGGGGAFQEVAKRGGCGRCVTAAVGHSLQAPLRATEGV